MAHGLNTVLKRNNGALGCKGEGAKTGIGSRRIFPPHFKLQVLDSYRNDADCKGNQRATARKYGIHRRQIQKWLQAESNLRNSVGKVKAENPEARKCGIEMALRGIEPRQRDDYGQDAYCQSEGRVPALSPVAYADGSSSSDGQRSPQRTSAAPLDFTTHSRVNASPVVASPDPPAPAPMDLSLKRPAPVCLPPSPHTFHCSPSPPRLQSPITLTCLSQTQPDAWDLSTKSNKRKCEELPDSLYSPNSTSSTSSIQAPKPVKLFKPYLDDEYSATEDRKPEIAPLCCAQNYSYPPNIIIESCYISNSSNTYNKNNYKYNDNNNKYHDNNKYNDNNKYSDTNKYSDNNNRYSDNYNNNGFNNNSIKSEYSYTLHELQPTKTSFNYYYHPLPSKYSLYSPSESETSPQYPYEDNLLESPPLKQRQSYSLDFKLSAIECYYQDEYCRGNQRAVASKYNIHRRQVQKWLKQEEELRQRNESVKQMPVVR